VEKSTTKFKGVLSAKVRAKLKISEKIKQPSAYIRKRKQKEKYKSYPKLGSNPFS